MSSLRSFYWNITEFGLYIIQVITVNDMKRVIQYMFINLKKWSMSIIIRPLACLVVTWESND